MNKSDKMIVVLIVLVSLFTIGAGIVGEHYLRYPNISQEKAE